LLLAYVSPLLEKHEHVPSEEQRPLFEHTASSLVPTTDTYLVPNLSKTVVTPSVYISTFPAAALMAESMTGFRGGLLPKFWMNSIWTTPRARAHTEDTPAEKVTLTSVFIDRGARGGVRGGEFVKKNGRERENMRQRT
jgi:hypothetical protein